MTGEPYDLDAVRQLAPGPMMSKISKDFAFAAMPPVGMSKTQVRIGSDMRVQYTVRCGADDCWFVGHGATQPDAQIVLDEHKCPTPPARNEIPSGRSTLEKTWDELDDVTRALICNTEYNGMSGDTLKGYAKGVAFTLSMMTHPFYRTIRDIAQEARQRYLMAEGTVPYRPTPSYRYNPMPTPTPGVISTVPAAKAPPARKVAAKKTPATTAEISADKIAAVKAAKSSGMFSNTDIATMYQLTEQQVESI